LDKPIINSLLDLDKYKLTMCQIVHDLHPTVDVTYSFSNRTTDVPLAQYIDIDELKEQIDHIKSIRFNYDELTYLSSQPEFKPEFINFLATQNYNVDFAISKNKNQIGLEFSGKWESAILYETLILSLINEMFGRNIVKCLNNFKLRGVDNPFNKLVDKLYLIKEHSDAGIKFIEFGTRRRYSQEWQKQVIQCCKELAPNNIIGTSNYWMAKEFNLKPIGTVAHEWFQVRSALDQKIYGTHIDSFSISSLPCRDTQIKSINAWLDYYGKPLSIILTDTFGTKSFIKDFTLKLAYNCLGTRQDSGDPVKFANTMIDRYNNMGIDPKDKTIVFSDGLTVDKIISLYKEFGDKINVVFGWGTDLTNSVGIKPLSIVIKATRANGIETCKLSDNLNKAIGSPETIRKYIQVFQPEQTNDEVVY
jgi:nicotinate phosphoribosyltransferase